MEITSELKWICLTSASIRRGELVWSIVPSLIGWAALCGAVVVNAQINQQRLILLILISGFAAQLIADFRVRHILTAALWPDWFMRLRVELTAVACASLAVLLFIQ